MKFTENFSEETKLKAQFLEQMDLNEEKENIEIEALWQTKLDEVKKSTKRELLEQIDLSGEQGQLKMELLEQIDLYMIYIEQECRKKGMEEAEILEEIKQKIPETFYHYQESIKKLNQGINDLKMLNELVAKREEIIKGRGR